MKRIILVTGPPGIGKTSMLRRTVKELTKRNFAVGGMICREVREGGLRVGFEVMDLATGQRGWLAHVNQSNGPVVGKYHVNLVDLSMVGAGSIIDAVHNADILAIDEIGPMELLSPAFRRALMQAVNSNKPMLGTIHYRLSNAIVNDIKSREDTEILGVTRENRLTLNDIVVEKITKCLI